MTAAEADDIMALVQLNLSHDERIQAALQQMQTQQQQRQRGRGSDSDSDDGDDDGAAEVSSRMARRRTACCCAGLTFCTACKRLTRTHGPLHRRLGWPGPQASQGRVVEFGDAPDEPDLLEALNNKHGRGQQQQQQHKQGAGKKGGAGAAAAMQQQQQLAQHKVGEMAHAEPDVPAASRLQLFGDAGGGGEGCHSWGGLGLCQQLADHLEALNFQEPTQVILLGRAAQQLFVFGRASQCDVCVHCRHASATNAARGEQHRLTHAPAPAGAAALHPRLAVWAGCARALAHRLRQDAGLPGAHRADAAGAQDNTGSQQCPS